MSPDGSRIAYSRDQSPGTSHIYVANADGSGATQLTNAGTGVLDTAPAWSPDGTKIAFSRTQCPSTTCNPTHIITMNSDGTGQTDVTPTETAAPFPSSFPSWQPIPQSYARPRGATPSEIFLVPAYAECPAGNRTHGAPLSFPSCAPPIQASGQLTVGTPDANGQPAKSFAKVVYAARSGDLALTAAITDVRKKSELSDYTGELSLVSELRITDKDNTPNPSGPGPGTVQDVALPVTISCSPTADTTVGSSCSLATTVNALCPGAITAGQRSIWQLGQVKAYDGGADGDAATTGDNTLFMDEGIFIP